MRKKILISAKVQQDIIGELIKSLENIGDIDFIWHDPTKNSENIDLLDLFNGIDYLILKVSNNNSLNLLKYAIDNNIPLLHDLDTVLLCHNKLALDGEIRNIFENYSGEIQNIKLPDSWKYSIEDKEEFKGWVSQHIPIVIKSPYQYDDSMRFNFLVRTINEVDYFFERYSHFKGKYVYLQKFIACDGIDRKIYIIGNEISGVKRENPIYIFMRDHPNDIDVSEIDRESFEITEEMRILAKKISKELRLKIFGFDLVKLKNKNIYYLVDLNEFPGFRKITGAANALITLIKEELVKY
ncbi:MAG: ATP-grasp domain-containing protein [Promethearchaeota archaeon]